MKRWMALLLATAMCFYLVACGNTASDNSQLAESQAKVKELEEKPAEAETKAAELESQVNSIQDTASQQQDIPQAGNELVELNPGDSITSDLEVLNEPVQAETYSSNETRIEILEIYKSGLVSVQSGLEYMSGELDALSSSQSYAYKVSRLVTAYQYEQLYLKKAVEYWEDASALCDDYSDTQVMKLYLTQLIALYSDVLSYEITTDNVVDYMTNVRFVDTTEIDNNIQSIVDAWVADAIN